MTRTYNRKTEKVLKSDIIEAVRILKLTRRSGKPLSIRTVAATMGVPKSSVFNYFDKTRGLDVLPEDYGVVTHHRQVLTNKEEEELVSYLKECMRSNHCLVPIQIRKLVYSYVTTNEVRCPDNWKRDKMAGKDWFSCFMKRNNCLSIRKPEATSQARAAGFNYVVVQEFQANLERIFARHNYPPHRIGNADESSAPTVMTPTRVVALRGMRQVQQTTGAERGTNVTMVGFGNAAGGTIPPAYVFPLRKVNPRSMQNAFPGSLALANGSGWMDGENFYLYMKHLQHHVKSCKEDPFLLILDNHSSHLDYRVVKFARENYIEMLTLPPHTSHELQPLDVAVFGPFKRAFSYAHLEWYRNNPGARISIHDIAGLSREPFVRAFTPSNLLAGFAKTGICPFKYFHHDDSRFAPSLVTDLPAVEAQIIPEPAIEPNFNLEEDVNDQQADERAEAYSLDVTPPSMPVQNRNEVSSPPNVPVRRLPLTQILPPLPRVPQTGPRKRTGNRLGRTRILTNNDEFQLIQQEEERRCEKEKRKLDMAERQASKKKSLPKAPREPELTRRPRGRPRKSDSVPLVEPVVRPQLQESTAIDDEMLQTKKVGPIRRSRRRLPARPQEESEKENIYDV